MGIAIILTIVVILLVATRLISKKCNQNLQIISNSFYMTTKFRYFMTMIFRYYLFSI